MKFKVGDLVKITTDGAVGIVAEVGHHRNGRNWLEYVNIHFTEFSNCWVHETNLRLTSNFEALKWRLTNEISMEYTTMAPTIPHFTDR